MNSETTLAGPVNPWWNNGWITAGLGLAVAVLSTLMLWPTASVLLSAFGTVVGNLVENGRLGWGILWAVMSLMNLGEVVTDLAL